MTSDFVRRERLQTKLREMEASLAGTPIPRVSTKRRLTDKDITHDEWHREWDETLTKRVRREVQEMEDVLLEYGGIPVDEPATADSPPSEDEGVSAPAPDPAVVEGTPSQVTEADPW